MEDGDFQSEDLDHEYHYDDWNDVPPDIQKYWEQRYDIFSKYDEGVWLTDTAWFGVTPEPIANRIASDLAAAAPKSKSILIDAFAGAGGNVIAFALSGRWNQIFAVEKDAETLECAKHNAEIYGVANRISWIQGDVFRILSKRFKGRQEAVVIFASPPWGGPGYRDDQVFNVNQMQPYGLTALCEPFSRLTDELVLYLPRTSDLEQLAQCSKDGRRIGVRHYCMQGASKALCVYFGSLNPI